VQSIEAFSHVGGSHRQIDLGRRSYSKHRFLRPFQYRDKSFQGLKEVPPITQELSTTAIRHRLRQMAQRLEDELGEERDMFISGCQRDWDQLPDPAAPLIVGIDGGYVHAKDQQSRAEGWFEVIVGKSMSQDGESSKCFEWIQARS